MKTCTEYYVKLPGGQYLIPSCSPRSKPVAVIDRPVAWEDRHDAECYASQIDGAEVIEGETYEYVDI